MALPKEYLFSISFWYFVSGCEMVCYQPILPDFIKFIGEDEKAIGLVVGIYG